MKKRLILGIVWFLILSVVMVSGDWVREAPFVPQYVFAHTNETIALLGANEWTNITFSQESTALQSGILHSLDETNTTFTITEAGIYKIHYDIDVIDTSPSASDIDIAMRAVFINGTEILGSIFEVDVIKQNSETEINHEFLAGLVVGDKIVFQFIATDADVVMSTHATFGDHPDTATIVIAKTADLI